MDAACTCRDVVHRGRRSPDEMTDSTRVQPTSDMSRERRPARGTDSLEDEASLHPALQQYNLEQFITVDVPESSHQVRRV
jgi:hypothetical protein